MHALRKTVALPDGSRITRLVTDERALAACGDLGPQVNASDAWGEATTSAIAAGGPALLSVLEAAGLAVALLDVAGRITTATKSFERMLAFDAKRMVVRRATRAVAADVRRPIAEGRRDQGPATPARTATSRIATAAGAYRLTAAWPGGRWTAVFAERRAAPVADDEMLRAPTDAGLSAREWQVARLLASGHTTAETGATLGISAHTARHHAESVYAKLGVRSRAMLGAVVANAGRGGR